MSEYSNYLRKLNFGTTSDSINAMKDREISKLSNPLEQKYEGIQAQMGQLTSGMASISSSDQIAKTTEDIISGVGTGAETLSSALGMKKLLGKIINRTNEKDESDMPIKEVSNEETVESKVSDTPDISERTDTSEISSENLTPSANVQEIEMQNLGTSGPDNIDYTPDPENFGQNISGGLSQDSAPFTRSTQPGQSVGGGDSEVSVSDENFGQNISGGLDVSKSAPFTNSVEKASETGSDIAEGISGDVGEVAGEASEAIGEAGAGIAEAVGAGLESVPVVGQILGTLLMAGGAIFGALTSSGENTSTESDEKQMGEDQTAEANLKLQELKNQANVSKEQFTGSNVMESLSSTANQAITSTSF